MKEIRVKFKKVFLQSALLLLLLSLDAALRTPTHNGSRWQFCLLASSKHFIFVVAIVVGTLNACFPLLL